MGRVAVRMSVRSGEVLKYVVSGCLTLFLLYLSFQGADTGALVIAVVTADYRWLLLMFALLMASHVLRAIRWGYLLTPVKHGIGFRNLFSGVMVGYLVNNILPRAGELVRPYALGKLERISRSAALGTIVVERMIDAASFLILLVIIPLVYDGPLRETFPWLVNAGILLTAGMALSLALIYLFVSRRDLTTRAIRVVSRIFPPRWHTRFSEVVHSFLDGFLIIRHPRHIMMLLLLSVGIWFFYIAMTRAAFQAFQLEDLIGWRGAVVVLAISSIGIAVPTPGSTGGYHFFASKTLSALFFVSPEVALGFATLTHGVGFVGTTAVGLYFLLRDHIRISDAVHSGEGVSS